MCIIRRKKTETKFAQIDTNSLENPNLSWKAKGLLSYLLSRPNNWTILIPSLIKQSTDGETAIRTGLVELEKEGYLTREPVANDKGRIIKWEKVIYETPHLNPEWKAKASIEDANPTIKEKQTRNTNNSITQPEKVEQTHQKEGSQTPGPKETTIEVPKEKIEKKDTLKFTKTFDETEKETMRTMLQGINKAQQLIEVLEKMMSRSEIKNPVAYLAGIIKKYKEKKFTPVSKEPKTSQPETIQPPKGPNGHTDVKTRNRVEEEDTKEIAIKNCHFCNRSGHIIFEYRDGHTKRMNCMHPPEEKVLKHVQKIDVLIVSADPGYKGHREKKMPEVPKKKTTELQQEFLNALQKFGKNNSFGDDK